MNEVDEIKRLHAEVVADKAAIEAKELRIGELVDRLAKEHKDDNNWIWRNIQGINLHTLHRCQRAWLYHCRVDWRNKPKPETDRGISAADC